MHLIQGFFFQNQEWLGLGCKPGDGVVAVLERGLLQTMYAGIIYDDPRSGCLVGKMIDHYGSSELSTVFLGGNRFTFTKKYHRRSDSILYTFQIREGTIWSGQYEGENVGKGITQCSLIEVTESFADLGQLMRTLGVNKAHQWKEA